MIANRIPASIMGYAMMESTPLRVNVQMDLLGTTVV